jgi:hypothetical protein
MRIILAYLRMDKMKIIFIVYLFGLFIALVYLWFMNRGSDVILEKLFPALAIGITGAFFTLWLSLKEEDIKMQFPATLIYHVKSGEALEKCDEKYQTLYGSKFYQIRRYLKAPISNHDIKCFERHEDILFLETLALLFTSPPEIVNDQIFPHFLHNTEDPALRYFPNQTLSWQEFVSRYLKNNGRSEIIELYTNLPPSTFDLGYIKEMCFPKGTTIKFAYDIIIKGVIYKNAIRKISLKNDFCEVNIVIRNIEGVRGLGEWKWILGYDDDKSNEYWSSSQRVYLTAKFNKL